MSVEGNPITTLKRMEWEGGRHSPDGYPKLKFRTFLLWFLLDRKARDTLTSPFLRPCNERSRQETYSSRNVRPPN